MFEKVVQNITDDPRNDEKIEAFLHIIAGLEAPDDKATALAQLAQALMPCGAPQAFDYISSAFKLSPRNLLVHKSALRLLEQYAHPDAVAKFKKLTASGQAQMAHKGTEFGGDAFAAATLVKGISASGTHVSSSAEEIDTDLDTDFDTSLGTELEAGQSSPFARFRWLLNEHQVDPKLFKYADAFADSTLGLVHFLHCLTSVHKLSPIESKRCCAGLLAILQGQEANEQALGRYKEFFANPHKLEVAKASSTL